MRQLTDFGAYAGAATAGLLLWIGTALVSGRREAWDAGLYWTAGYPAGLLISGILGYLAPLRAWRWGFTLMLVQAVALAAMASSFGLLPLGLIMFAVLAVPPAAVAVVVAAFRRRDPASTPS